jgi:hypothetical protein
MSSTGNLAEFGIVPSLQKIMTWRDGFIQSVNLIVLL